MTLSLSALLTRTGADGLPGDYDCLIYFIAVCTSPGRPGRYPAEDPEYDFEVTGIEFDDGEPLDAPGPLTEAEMATLTAWFVAHYELACREVAESDCEPEFDSYRLEAI